MSREMVTDVEPQRGRQLVTRRVRAVGTHEELSAQCEGREVFARRRSSRRFRGGARMRCEVWFGVKALRDKQFVAGRVRAVGIDEELSAQSGCREVFG
jgi:hypothetical protein